MPEPTDRVDGAVSELLIGPNGKALQTTPGQLQTDRHILRVDPTDPAAAIQGRRDQANLLSQLAFSVEAMRQELLLLRNSRLDVTPNLDKYLRSQERYDRQRDTGPILVMTGANAAYTAADVVGSAFALPTMSAYPGGGCMIDNILLMNEDTTAASVMFDFFTAKPTVAADNAAFAPTDAEVVSAFVGRLGAVATNNATQTWTGNRADSAFGNTTANAVGTGIFRVTTGLVDASLWVVPLCNTAWTQASGANLWTRILYHWI